MTAARRASWTGLVAALSFLAVVGDGSPARAQAELPGVRRIVPAGDRLWLVTSGGLLSLDRSPAHAPPSFFTDATLGYRGAFVPVVAAAPGGPVYVGTYAGLALSSDGRCFQLAPALAGQWVTGVTLRPDDPHGALATAATTGGADNGLYATHDAGATWTRTTLASARQYYESVAIPPTRPTRIYVTSYGPAAGAAGFAGSLWVSDDGGAHFAAHPLSYRGASDAKIVGVGAKSPDEIYLRLEEAVDGQAVLLRSRDAGVSFTLLLALPWEDGPEAIPEPLAVLPDGHTLAAATRDGLLISSDDGDTWSRNAALATALGSVAADSARIYVGGGQGTGGAALAELDALGGPATTLLPLATLLSLPPSVPSCHPEGKP